MKGEKVVFLWHCSCAVGTNCINQSFVRANKHAQCICHCTPEITEPSCAAFIPCVRLFTVFVPGPVPSFGWKKNRWPSWTHLKVEAAGTWFLSLGKKRCSLNWGINPVVYRGCTVGVCEVMQDSVCGKIVVIVRYRFYWLLFFFLTDGLITFWVGQELLLPTSGTNFRTQKKDGGKDRKQ